MRTAAAISLSESPHSLCDSSPQTPRRAELRDAAEHVGVECQLELELSEGALDGQPGSSHRSQIRGAGGEHTRELLGVGGSGVVVGRPGRSRGRRPGQLALGVGGELGELLESAFDTLGQRTGARERPQRVGAEGESRRSRRFGREALASRERNQRGRGRREGGTCVERERDGIEANALESPLEVGEAREP